MKKPQRFPCSIITLVLTVKQCTKLPTIGYCLVSCGVHLGIGTFTLFGGFGAVKYYFPQSVLILPLTVCLGIKAKKKENSCCQSKTIPSLGPKYPILPYIHYFTPPVLSASKSESAGKRLSASKSIGNVTRWRLGYWTSYCIVGPAQFPPREHMCLV